MSSIASFGKTKSKFLAVVFTLISTASHACIADSIGLTQDLYTSTRQLLLTQQENIKLGSHQIVIIDASPLTSPIVDEENIYVSRQFLDGLSCYILANTMVNYGANRLFPEMWLDHLIHRFSGASSITSNNEKLYTGPPPKMPIEFISSNESPFTEQQEQEMLMLTVAIFSYAISNILFHEIGHVVEDALYMEEDATAFKRQMEVRADNFSDVIFERWLSELEATEFAAFPYVGRYFTQAYFFDASYVVAGLNGVRLNRNYDSPHIRVLRDGERIPCELIPRVGDFCKLMNTGVEKMRNPSSTEAYYRDRVDLHGFATYRLAHIEFEKNNYRTACEMLFDINSNIGALNPINSAFCLENQYLGSLMSSDQQLRTAYDYHQVNAENGWLVGLYGMARLEDQLR